MPLGPLLMVNPRRKRRRTRNMPKRNRRGQFVKTPKRKRRRKNPWVSSGRSGGSYSAYAKPKVTTYRRRVRKKKTTTKKRKPVRRKNMAKSRKRSLAAKKAWRTRRRRNSAQYNPKRRRRRRRNVSQYNPRRRKRKTTRRRRRRNPYVKAGRGGGEVWIDGRTREYRTLYRKKRRKTVAKRRKKRTYKRKGKRRSYPRKRRVYGKKRRSRAMKAAWRRRRKGYRRKGRKKIFYRTRRGRRVKRAYKSKRTGRYSIWRNPDMLKDIALPLGLASLGFIGSALLMTAAPVQSQIAKLSPGTQKIARIGVPIAAALAIMTFGPKVKALAKYSKHMYFLAFGLAMAGGVAGLKEVLSGTAIGTKLGLSGYVSTPMRGYVRRPLMGYVRQRGLGQLEERAPRSLGSAMKRGGSAVQYRGAMVPAHVPSQTMTRAVGYLPGSSKPYGLGLPQDTRRYNEFGFTGVYDKATYE